MAEEDQEAEVELAEHQRDFALEDEPDLEITITCVDRFSPIFEELQRQLGVELPARVPRVEAPELKHVPTPYKRNPKDLES